MNKFQKGSNLPKPKIISPLDSLIISAPLKLIEKLPENKS